MAPMPIEGAYAGPPLTGDELTAELAQLAELCGQNCEARATPQCELDLQTVEQCSDACVRDAERHLGFCLTQLQAELSCKLAGGYGCERDWVQPVDACAAEAQQHQECRLYADCSAYCVAAVQQGCAPETTAEECAARCAAERDALPETCGADHDSLMNCTASAGAWDCVEARLVAVDGGCERFVNGTAECRMSETSNYCASYCLAAELGGCGEGCWEECSRELTSDDCAGQYMDALDCLLGTSGDGVCMDGQFAPAGGTISCDSDWDAYLACLTRNRLEPAPPAPEPPPVAAPLEDAALTQKLGEIDALCAQSCQQRQATGCTANEDAELCQRSCNSIATSFGGFCLDEYQTREACYLAGGFECTGSTARPVDTCIPQAEAIDTCIEALDCELYCHAAVAAGCDESGSLAGCVAACQAEGAALPETCQRDYQSLVGCVGRSTAASCVQGRWIDAELRCDSYRERFMACQLRETGNYCKTYCDSSAWAGCAEGCAERCARELTDPSCGGQYFEALDCAAFFTSGACVDGVLEPDTVNCEDEWNAHLACLAETRLP